MIYILTLFNVTHQLSSAGHKIFCRYTFYIPLIAKTSLIIILLVLFCLQTLILLASTATYFVFKQSAWRQQIIFQSHWSWNQYLCFKSVWLNVDYLPITPLIFPAASYLLIWKWRNQIGEFTLHVTTTTASDKQFFSNSIIWSITLLVSKNEEW